VAIENSVFSNLSIKPCRNTANQKASKAIFCEATVPPLLLERTEKISNTLFYRGKLRLLAKTSARQFSLGVPESTLVEEQKLKVLCMSIGENRLSVFMGKNKNLPRG